MTRWFAIAGLLFSQAAWAECADYATNPGKLVELEGLATKGTLGDEHRKCLETSYASAEVQTTKDKISRVLMVDAYAYDTDVWAKLVDRHLEEVDQSDPDIAYLYAFHLYNTDKAEASEVIDWTETALDRRDIWKGATYVSRVYGLMKLRAIASNAVWESAERERAGSGTSAEVLTRIDTERNRTKTFAREWLDFAKVSGKSVVEPKALCLSAGSAKACGLE